LQALAFSVRAPRSAAAARSRSGRTRAGFHAMSFGHFEVRVRPFFKSVRLIEM
jgi:hypothetical protein